MDCSQNQCCAIGLNNARCKNTCIGSSDHCESHRDTAVKLYHNYKKLQDKVDSLDFDKNIKNTKNKIDYVMKCYFLLKRTFLARSKHRQYAYVPECHDDGHDYQFIKLTKQIDECENKLTSLYKIHEKETTIEEDQDEENEIGHSSENEKIRKQIRKFKKTRNDTDEWIEKYNKENEEILSKRLNYIRLIDEEAISLFGDDDLFIKNVALFNMVRKLYSIGYFFDTFKPNKCQHCNCGNYMPFDVKLACSCIIDNNTVFKYFNLSTEDVLKLYYETLTKNKEKIRPIVEDLKLLYLLYNEQIICIRLWLEWNIDQNRLILVENYLPPQIKTSKLLSLNRLKNNAYSKRIEMILN